LESIRNLYFGNDSKGGAFTVLTRFLTDKYNLKVEIISLIIVIIYLLLKMLPYGNDIIDKIKEKLSQDNVKFVVSGLFVLIAFWGCSGLAILNHTYSDLIIPLSLGVLLIMAVNAYIFFEQGDGSKNYRLIILPLLTLAYCNTQTAGYNFAGMFFIISFSSAYLITYLLKIIPINSAFIYTLLLCVIPSLAIGKAMTQYSWWGLRQSNIINAKYEIDNKELEGIYVDDITKKIFTLINRSINSYSKKENDVYLFPSIPIFYLLNNKIPGTPNIVQWFDVISSKDIEQEYDFIAKLKPRVIIALIPPKIVFDGHAQLIKRDLYQEKIIKLMKKNVLNNKYKLVSFEIVDQELEYKYKNRDIVKAIVAIVNDNYIGMPISKIYNDFKFVLNDLELSLPQKGDTLQPIIRKGDILRVTVRRDGLSAIVKALGWMNSMTSEKDYSYYTVLILVRSND